MAKQITAMTLVGLEQLYRDARRAALDLKALPKQDAAIDEAVSLMEDIAAATAVVRWPQPRRSYAEHKRRGEISKSGG